MKYVWVAAAVAPLAFAASLAQAQTTVNSGSSTPLSTSTAGDITIGTSGAITLPTTAAPPVAVTLNSHNTVTNNGSIAATGINNAIGIQALGGNTGEIINSGSISIGENDTSADANSDGVVDTENGVKGEYASGSGRYGILISGPGTFTGVADTTNNAGAVTALFSGGSINVIGENSAGIAVLTSVTGDIVINGVISVTGGNLGTNDVSYGVLTTAQINGNVKLGGSITSTGGNAVGVAINDGATGAVTVSASITSTGFRNTSPRTTFGIGTIALIEQTPAEMMQGGPAFWLGGNVGGGLNVTAAVAGAAATSTTPAVTAVNAGTLVSFGDAPALLVGNGTTTTTIAPVSGDTHGILIGGSVSSSGVYDNVNSVAMQVGGSYNGTTLQPVDVEGGISITGTVAASSFGNPNPLIPTTFGNGSAIGLDIGAGATVPKIDNIGSITATSLSNQTTNLPTVTALEIDKGATVGIAITNNGLISAALGATDIVSNNVVVAQGGTAGTVTAILDNAGAITSLVNTNTISASFDPANATDIITGTAVALNLSANTVGVTVTQNPGTISSTSSTGVVTTTATTPSITGDVLFGSGAAILNLNTGTLTGDTSFGNSLGTSTGNQINIAGGAIMKGGLTVGPGGAVAVNVSNGLLNMTNVTGNTITTPTVNVGATGELIFSADPAGSEAIKNGQFDVSANPGTLTVASGAKIGLNLLSAVPGTAIAGAPEHFTVILANAGDVSQLSNFSLGTTPYLYHITLDTTYQPDALTIDVARATAAQLNLNSNQAAAYNAIYNAFITDPGVEADVLSKSNESSFKKIYDQFLPDFAGGPFESLAIGQRAIIRTQETDPLKLETDQTRGWVQEIGFLTHQGDSDSAGYDAGGFGVSAGAEVAKGSGVVGVSGAFLSTEVTDTGQDSYGHMAGSLLEAGVYWRSSGSGINANASLDGGYAWFDSQRQILDTAANPAAASNPNVPTTTTTLQRTAAAQWGGGLISGQVGLNAPIEFGHFYLRPEVSADYIALFEEGYTERGGGSAFDLTVAPRTSQQASAQVDLVLGATFGDAIKYRPELMVGWRGVVEGGPGVTTAHFSSGSTNFNLNADFQDRGGLLARLGLRAGGQFADFTADAGGEWHGNFDSYDARALARFLF